MTAWHRIWELLTRSARDYYTIAPQILLFQAIARIGQFLLLAGAGRVIWPWVIRAEVSLSLTNFDLLRGVEPARAAVAVFLFSLVFLTAYFYEYLGTIYITDRYYAGEPIHVRRALWAILRITPRFLRALALQVAIYVGILFLTGMSALTFYTVVPDPYNLILIAPTLFLGAYFLWDTYLKLTYVNYRLFEIKDSFFEVFSYRLNREQLLERRWFSLLQIGAVVAYIYGGGYLLGASLQGVARIARSLYAISLGAALVVAVSLLLSTAVSIIFTSFATLYRSRAYHEDFAGITPHKSGTHDYLYESIVLYNWYHYRLGVIALTLTLLVGFVFIQAEQNRPQLQAYLERDFVTMAHRGGVGAAENTLEAVENSIAAGIDVVEVDLQLTRDGEVIVFHDQTLAKVGLPTRNVFATNLADLRELTYPNGEKIPTLDELLARTQNRIGLNLELKLYDGRSLALEEAVRAQLENYVSERPLWITSLESELIERWEATSPADITGLIVTASADDLQNTPVDWLIVNDFYYAQTPGQFADIEKPIALWSFDPNWTGEQAFEAGLAGAVTDRPVDLQGRENYFEGLELAEQVPRITVWNFTR